MGKLPHYGVKLFSPQKTGSLPGGNAQKGAGFLYNIRFSNRCFRPSESILRTESIRLILEIVGDTKLVKDVEQQTHEHSDDAGKHHTLELDAAEIHGDAGETRHKHDGRKRLGMRRSKFTLESTRIRSPDTPIMP